MRELISLITVWVCSKIRRYRMTSPEKAEAHTHTHSLVCFDLNSVEYVPAKKNRKKK